jgi:hypothetical protein
LALARIEFSAENPAAALAVLQRGDTALARYGESGYRCTVQAYMAEAHESLDRAADAHAALERSAELSTPEDIINFIITHRVRARLALAEGDADGAEDWARSAVQYALSTDFVWETARSRLNLAEVLSVGGRSDEAAVEAQTALELYELKGDRPGAAVARLRLSQIRASGV